MELTGDKHFKKKNGKDSRLDPIIAENVKNRMKNGKLPCVAAFEIANSLKINPEKIGMTADMLGVSLSECQLGLFGHGPDKKIVKAESSKNPDLLDSIKNASTGGKLNCAAAWRIAKLFKAPRLKISDTCEARRIKITRCQLGAF